MKKISLILVLFAVLAVACSGCASDPYFADRMLNSTATALVGGAVGAGLGYAITGNSSGVGRGAAAGAAAGMAAGFLSPVGRSGYGYGYTTLGVNCNAFPTQGERDACRRGQATRAINQQKQNENNAYRAGYGLPSW